MKEFKSEKQTLPNLKEQVSLLQKENRFLLDKEASTERTNTEIIESLRSQNQTLIKFLTECEYNLRLYTQKEIDLWKRVKTYLNEIK